MKHEMPYSILLADDHETFLMYIGIVAKRLGFQTFVARDGEEALEVAREKKPSLIVLDYMMPKLDGSSCMHLIRNDPDLKNIPVIILTAHDVSRKEMEQVGCCGFLKKPVNISEFYSVVRDCMKQVSHGENKRKNIRTLSNLKVSISCENERRELCATSISQEGMYLRTVAPFMSGTVMDIVFALDDKPPMELKAEVIYSNRLSTELEPEPGMGIRFLNIPEAVKKRIESFVMNTVSGDLAAEFKDMSSDTV